MSICSGLIHVVVRVHLSEYSDPKSGYLVRDHPRQERGHEGMSGCKAQESAGSAIYDVGKIIFAFESQRTATAGR